MTLSAALYRWLNRSNFVTADFADAQRRLLSSPDVTAVEKKLLEDVALHVSVADEMYAGDPFHYLSVGLSAVRCIREGMRSARTKSPVDAVLDFPCGHGRVLRFLRAMFPGAAITCVDIDTHALNFCRWMFGAAPVASASGFDDLTFPRRFDLIWCGSLLTHLDEKGAAALLRVFHDNLQDRGSCVFTTHGQRAAAWIESGTVTYGLEDDARRKLLREFQSTGYGYADLPDSPAYGVSAASRERVLELAGNAGNWRETMFVESGWDNHQDVYAFSRTS